MSCEGLYMTNRDVLIPFVFAVVATLPACGKEYAAEPITATVIDAETKKPIEGALVVARWIANSRNIVGQVTDVGTVEVKDAITDASGKFHFDGWGLEYYRGDGQLEDEDPRLTIFKHGYKLHTVANGQFSKPSGKQYGGRAKRSVRSSSWDGETIGLTPFKGSIEEFALFVYTPLISTDVMALASPTKSPCAWARIPRAVSYLEQERRAIVKLGGSVGSFLEHLLHNDSYFVGQGCPSPRQVFGT